MSIRADITQAAGWFAHEDKFLNITITDANGDPVNITGLDLLWRVMRGPGSATVMLTKETPDITVTGTDNNIATIEVDPASDYDDLPAGIHYHELWSVTDNLLLAYGDAFLNAATAPV